jgi:hypothetical protein
MIKQSIIDARQEFVAIILVLVSTLNASYVVAQNDELNMQLRTRNSSFRSVFLNRDHFLNRDDQALKTKIVDLMRRRPTKLYAQVLREHLAENPDSELAATYQEAIAEIESSYVPKLVDPQEAADVSVHDPDVLLDYRVLDLANVALADFDIAALPTQRELRFLMCPVGITDEHAASIAQCEDLRTLLLGRADITDVGVAHLSKLPKLDALDLSQCESITSDCLDSLLKLPKLTKLYLPPQIASYLLPKLKAITTLEVLMLSGDQEIGMVKLMCEPQAVKHLLLQNSNLDDAQIANLRSTYPNVELTVQKRQNAAATDAQR